MKWVEVEEEPPSLSPSQLIHLAESHLRVRNFSLSRQYALEALQPNFDPYGVPHRRISHRVSEIVSVSDVLSASTPANSTTNWYAVLGIDTFSSDVDLIRDRYKYLVLILAPFRGKSDLAEEAFKAVMQAWNVLLDPVKKQQLDEQLKVEIGGDSSGESSEKTFWTFCPYCYHMYEFEEIYRGLCLRCQNEECRRAFDAIAAQNPPSAWLKNTESVSCYGCYPLGISQFKGKRKVKFGSGSHFVGMVSLSKSSADGKNGNWNEKDGVVEILDDSEASLCSGKGISKADFADLNSVSMDEKESMGGYGKNMNVNLNEVDWNAGEGHGHRSAQNTMEGTEGCPDIDVGFFEKNGEIFVELPPDDGTF